VVEKETIDTNILEENTDSPNQIPIFDISREIFANIQAFVSPQPQLKITEVYRDGTDEWIEITNLDDQIYSFSLTISGAKSTPITISNFSIQANQSIILGDNCSIIQDFSVVSKT
jgi:hypothetical protein